MRKIIFVILISALLIIALTACQTSASLEEEAFLSVDDFSDCELLIHNVTCSEVYERRTVDDKELFSDIASLCAEAVPFRPITAYDVILGGKNDPYCIFQSETESFTIAFFDVEEQLSLNNVHREEPMITANGWFCSLTPASYAKLVELLQRYTGGEIVK